MGNKNFIFNEDLIRSKIYNYNSPKRITIKDDFFRSSAVLFTIIPHSEEPYELVVIHRSNFGLRHKGEMSFPGGKYDDRYDKSLEDTALRETEEEIGVPRENVKILGCLHDFPTMSQYIITPFIGVINIDQPMVKDDREVQAIVKVPIDFFLSKEKFREQIHEIYGKKFPVYYHDYEERSSGKIYTIWGATAYMISRFFELVYGLNISNTGLRRFDLYEIKNMKELIFRRNKTS